MTTAREMIAALETLDPDIALGFATDAGEIGGGYHITELKHAQIRSIDCGGRIDSWDEVQLQLLDGAGGDWLTVGKAAQILARSVAALPELADAPLLVEFGHANSGLTRFRPAAPRQQGGRAMIALRPDAAACKPAVAFRKGMAHATAGTGAGTTASGCCGPAAAAGTGTACCG